MAKPKKVSYDDIDLTPFRVKKELHPDFFESDGSMKSQIRLRLLDIADDFVRDLEIKWVKPKDIVVTGSIVNYNWSKFSDVDIHIIYDFSKIYNKKTFVEDYFNAKKSAWNDSHDELTIKGFPVEISVEDVDKPAKSSGVYSLESNRWVEEPDEMDDASLDKERIKRFCARKMTEMNRLFAKMDAEKDRQKLKELSDKLESVYDELKQMRKDGLASKDMEMSDGNIIWKVIKHAGYIDKCWDYYDKVYDRVNTIDESVTGIGKSDGKSDGKPTAYLMIGMPGSGKSTWVKNNLPGLPVVSRDEIRSYEEVGLSSGADDKKVGTRDQEELVTSIEKELIRKLCEKGSDFVVDDTNTGKYRKGMVEYIRSCGASVVGVFVDTPLETCISRRDGMIPTDAMKRLSDRFRKPTEDEFDGFMSVSGKDPKTVVISENQMREIRARLDEIKLHDKWKIETERGKTRLNYGTYADICSIDPTVTVVGNNRMAGKYCNWLLQRFDLSKLSDRTYRNRLRIALEQYNDGLKRGILKREGISSDIGSFKSTDDFIAAINSLMQGETQLSQSASNHMDELKGQYEIVGNSPNWMIVAPKTWEAERYFGSGTEWCTVGSERYFNSYMDKDQLYITVPKNMDSKLKMQFHFPTEQFADFQDNVTDNPKLCIAKVLGESDDFDEVFAMWEKTNEDFNEYYYRNVKLGEVEQRIAEGERPESLMDRCHETSDGFKFVELHGKCNILDSEDRLLSPDLWFDECGGDFFDGYADVLVGEKWNFIGEDGRFLWQKPMDQWFDWCLNFDDDNGLAPIAFGKKHNFINKNCEFLWKKPIEEWFDGLSKFFGEFAPVRIGNKCNSLGLDGQLLWKKPFDQWFDFCDRFVDGFAEVRIGIKRNYLKKDGTLLWKKPVDEWFDYCGTFRDGFAEVRIDGKRYNIDTDGNLHDEKPTNRLDESLDEAVWPGFNPHEIERLPYFAQRVRWCEKNVSPCFGQGSARMIFEVDDDRVLKLAKNQKGVAQNEAEVDTSRYSDCVVKCFDYADDYSWVIEEQCIPAKKSDFKRVMGITFDEFCNIVRWHYKAYAHPNRSMFVHADSEKAEDMLDRLYDQDEYGFVPELIRLMGDYQLPHGDLTRISSYGLVRRDGEVQIVLIDSGLTNDVYDTYYARRI